MTEIEVLDRDIAFYRREEARYADRIGNLGLRILQGIGTDRLRADIMAAALREATDGLRYAQAGRERAERAREAALSRLAEEPKDPEDLTEFLPRLGPNARRISRDDEEV